MTLGTIRFDLKDLTLDDLIWLREQFNKYSKHVEVTVSAQKHGKIDDLRFAAALYAKEWTPEATTCLNTIAEHFKPKAK